MRSIIALLTIPVLLTACAGKRQPTLMPPAPHDAKAEESMLTLRHLAEPMNAEDAEVLLRRLGGTPIEVEGEEVEGPTAKMLIRLHKPVQAVVEALPLPGRVTNIVRGAVITMHRDEDGEELYDELSAWISQWMGPPIYAKEEISPAGQLRKISFWGILEDVVYVARAWLYHESTERGTAVRLIYRTDDPPNPAEARKEGGDGESEDLIPPPTR